MEGRLGEELGVGKDLGGGEAMDQGDLHRVMNGGRGG